MTVPPPIPKSPLEIPARNPMTSTGLKELGVCAIVYEVKAKGAEADARP
jgi:hypothetical protein